MPQDSPYYGYTDWKGCVNMNDQTEYQLNQTTFQVERVFTQDQSVKDIILNRVVETFPTFDGEHDNHV